MRGEGWGEGASPPGAELRRSESRRGPLTLVRFAHSTSPPAAGRGEANRSHCAHPGYVCLLQFGYLHNHFFRIESDCLGPIDQLDQGDALLANFYVADIGLGAAQPLGEINLAQAGNLATFDKERAQG